MLAIDIIAKELQGTKLTRGSALKIEDIVAALDAAGFAIVPKVADEQLGYVGTDSTLKEVHPHLCSVAYAAMVEASRVKL